MPLPIYPSNKKSSTLLGKTQKLQMIKRQNTTTNTPSHMNQKMIHYLATISTHTIPGHNLKTSSPQVVANIFPHIAIQTWKETYIGALTLQILFQGKMTQIDPLNTL